METLAPPAPPVPPAELAEPDPVLLEAARLLREGWTQGAYRKNPPLYLRLFGAKPRYCLYGALAVALRGVEAPDFIDGATGPSYSELQPYVEALGFEYGGEVFNFNDAPRRTQEEVVERVERAAYGL